MTLSQDPRDIADWKRALEILKKRHKCQCDQCVEKLLEKSKNQGMRPNSNDK